VSIQNGMRQMAINGCQKHAILLLQSAM